ncbi:response regulator transcription factor [Desnuesiella massiliensis]|uniref:response regulator transcription factor n=1 Tax=Desnuesiella massiliensis TaxID=1650662 RepID=UPI0006E23FC3|nr:response regulator [Desnuesiella massiliensis]
MIKVLVVDDEYLAREGMKRTINWTSLGCELSGEAEDAFKAIELSKVIKPDIIITDIKMPGMDGIKMAEKIKEYLPDCKFIIITGYDEFQYAKAAIKINALDFILKPIDENEFLEAVSKASLEALKIREEKNFTREKILLDIMRGKITNIDIIEEILYASKVKLRKIIVVNIENDNYHNILEEGREDLIYTQNRLIKNIIYENINEDCYVIECHQDRLAIIIDTEHIKDKEEIVTLLSFIQKEIKEKCKISVSMGLSTIGLIQNMNRLYSESKEALYDKLYKGRGSINFYKYEAHDIIESKTLNLLIEKYKREIILSINAKDKRNVEKQIKQVYYEIFKKLKVKSKLIKEFSIEVILSALKLLKEYNIVIAKVASGEFDAYKQISKLNTLDEIYELVNSIIISCLDELKEFSIETQDSGIEKALEYIKQHYHEDISLNDVAKTAYLSESYLSRKIKKILGIGFSEYITKLRMEKAKEYFRDPNIKVTEVASKLGYPDYRYFSHIFKKYTGYTPSEFSKVK